MLVLSRKKGEQIRIGNDIVITVQRLSGNRVSLGIDAPADCRVTRAELKTLLEELDYAGESEEPVRASSLLRRMPRSESPLGAKIAGETNRIAAHLPPSLRSPK